MSKELEIRFENFSTSVRDYCRKCKWDLINRECIKQLIRSSGSVSSNYIEAAECLGKADEMMHIRICLKEVKESRLWMNLILTYNNEVLEIDKALLIDEGFRIQRILGKILTKLTLKNPLSGKS